MESTLRHRLMPSVRITSGSVPPDWTELVPVQFVIVAGHSCSRLTQAPDSRPSDRVYVRRHTALLILDQKRRHACTGRQPKWSSCQPSVPSGKTIPVHGTERGCHLVASHFPSALTSPGAWRMHDFNTAPPVALKSDVAVPTRPRRRQSLELFGIEPRRFDALVG